MAQALLVDPVAESGRHVPFGRNFQAGEATGRQGQGLRRDEVVAVAMDEEDRRPRLDFARRPPPARPRRAARTAPNSRRSRPARIGRRSPTCSAIMVPWLKPTSASAHSGRLWRLSSSSMKRSSTGAALLTPIQRSFGSRKVSENHWRPVGACAHRSGACGDTKAASGSRAARPAPIDEVVAVGAIAVEKDDELARRSRSAAQAAGQ